MTAIAPGRSYRDRHTPERDRQHAVDARTCSQCGGTLGALNTVGVCTDCLAGRRNDDDPKLNVPYVSPELRAVLNANRWPGQRAPRRSTGTTPTEVYVAPHMRTVYDAGRDSTADPSHGDSMHHVRRHACPDCGGPARAVTRGRGLPQRVAVDHLGDCVFRAWAEFFRQRGA